MASSKSARTASEMVLDDSSFKPLTRRCLLLRAADRYAYRLWKHCLFCRDCLERRDIYILLTLALLCWRRPVSPHRRSPRRLTGDHPVDHALPGLTPSTANFPTPFPGSPVDRGPYQAEGAARAGGARKSITANTDRRLKQPDTLTSLAILVST